MVSLVVAKRKAEKKLTKEKGKNVFVGGNYDLMVILREICKFVEEAGFRPVLAYDFEVPMDEIHAFDMWLLEKCKYAVFELSKLDGQLMEIQRALDRGMDVFVFYGAREAKRRKPPSEISSMLTTSDVPAFGYFSIDELREIVRSIFPGIEIDRDGTMLRILRSSWLPSKLKPRIFTTLYGQHSMDGIPKIDVFPVELREHVERLAKYLLVTYPSGFSKRLAEKTLDIFRRQENFFYVENVFSHRNVFQKDLRILIDSLRRSRKLPNDDELVLEFRCALAVALSRLLPSKEALRILEVYKPVGKRPSLVFEYYLRLAREYYNIDDYKWALSELSNALRIRKIGKSSIFRARLLQASILTSSYEYKKAGELVRSILDKCVDTDVRMQASFLWAYLLDMTGLFKEASKEFEDLLHKNPRASLELAIRNNIAMIHNNLGETVRAEKELEGCLRLTEKDTTDMASVLGNIGVVVGQHGELDKALDSFQKALRIHEKIGNKPGTAQDYGNIGIVLFLQDELDKALEHHQKALKIDQEIGNKLGMAQDYGNIGIALSMQGKSKDALKSLSTSATLFTQIGASDQVREIEKAIALLKEKRS